eukprot:756779-Hanusia_phi.AAC.5
MICRFCANSLIFARDTCASVESDVFHGAGVMEEEEEEEEEAVNGYLAGIHESFSAKSTEFGSHSPTVVLVLTPRQVQVNFLRWTEQLRFNCDNVMFAVETRQSTEDVLQCIVREMSLGDDDALVEQIMDFWHTDCESRCLKAYVLVVDDEDVQHDEVGLSLSLRANVTDVETSEAAGDVAMGQAV